MSSFTGARVPRCGVVTCRCHACGDEHEIEPTDRRIPFEGLFNVRDLGGYETVDGRLTRWRRLYRADSLNRAVGRRHRPAGHAGPADGARSSYRRRTGRPRQVPGRSGPGRRTTTCRCSNKIWDSDAIEAGADGVAFLILRYEEMLSSGAASIATAVELLAEPDSYPAVFHCAAGKDRTGVLAAVVLGLLGVPHDSIATTTASAAAACRR